MKTFVSTLALLVVAGCSSSPSPAPAAAGGSSWRLEGTRIIACCCAMPCSCRLNKPPMQAHGCEYTTAVHIDRGAIGDVRMDGLNWLQVGLGFGENNKTNWVVVYIDDKATDAQLKALEGWMEAGMKAFNPKTLPYLAGAFAGFKKVPLTWQASKDGESYTVKVTGILDLQVKAIHNPGHPEPVTSAGVLDDFGNSFIHSDTLKHDYKDPSLPKYDGWDLQGRQSNYAHFVIGSGVTKPYTVGWGCWSAHKDLGTDGNYQERLLNHPKK